MEILTERFGTVVAEESMMIEMRAPVLGFPATSSYLLIEAGADSPFTWLQSVQEPALAFASVNPFEFFSDYDFELPLTDQEDLALVRAEEAQVLVLVTIPSRVEHMTVNLLAPIVINTTNRRAKQVVLYDSAYTTRHYLLPEEARMEDASAACVASGNA